ncbi:hypothetical protein [Nonomuraea sp. NPDC052265]|uniref:hypothetical protein n=1 Tax=Nonomuraea sp. NPDC052265 TaxID=3364374 RepID=UPI0037C5BE40
MTLRRLTSDDLEDCTRPATPAGLDTILALDAEVFGTDRSRRFLPFMPALG